MYVTNMSRLSGGKFSTLHFTEPASWLWRFTGFPILTLLFYALSALRLLICLHGVAHPGRTESSYNLYFHNNISPITFLELSCNLKFESSVPSPKPRDFKAVPTAPADRLWRSHSCFPPRCQFPEIPIGMATKIYGATSTKTTNTL